MKFPRALAVFLVAAGAILTLAILKALVISGLHTLPPVRILAFAGSMFGLVAAMIDWALLRDVIPPRRTAAQLRPDQIIEQARRRPIVFREICPPPATGLSFYGGVPIGPRQLVWPRIRNKPGSDAPLSFLMQWDCRELSRQDVTGFLPRNGVLYLFADLTWGEPFDFQFLHAAGPVEGWRPLPIPSGLPPIYGQNGAYTVPYCSPRLDQEDQDVPCLLPKWPFTPLAFSYPHSPSEPARFWNDGEAEAAALLRLQHPEGVPEPSARPKNQKPFGRPFSNFPHDYAAIRIVASKVLERTKDGGSRAEAVQHYRAAAAHPPHAAIPQSASDDLWQWIESLQPVLTPGWHSLVEDCANVSLGFGAGPPAALPADLIASCADRHQLAVVYAGKENPAHRKVLAGCPIHMFGPPSYVQGNVEEFIEEWILLLEISSRAPIGFEFGEGVLQFLIRKEDLNALQFDRVRLIASAY